MTAWRNVWTISKRELGAYFTSPLAYVFIVIFLLLCGFFTFFADHAGAAGGHRARHVVGAGPFAQPRHADAGA